MTVAAVGRVFVEGSIGVWDGEGGGGEERGGADVDLGVGMLNWTVFISLSGGMMWTGRALDEDGEEELRGSA